jgi:uncharacterized membrane protein
VHASRRAYLDWLRGMAVLIMIEAHIADAWTRPADRTLPAFGWAIVIGGMGAPLFLLLAGVAVALAAGSRTRRGGDPKAAARSVQRRGWQIFGYAFLFRLQSFVLNPGASISGLLKVDIQNVMGPAIAAAAWLWPRGGRLATRAWLLAAVTVFIAMVTPLVRTAGWIGWLPDPVEWYVRPAPGHTNFTLFPWAGFVMAGGAAGVFIDRTHDPAAERRTVFAVGALGAAMAAGGYALSFMPSIYPASNFWTSSPTFFFLRTGLLFLTIPIAWIWQRCPWPSVVPAPIVELGVSSLFVYWIHVEMVYGVLSAPLHRRLPMPWMFAAVAGFAVVMWGLVRLKNRIVAIWPPVTA